MTTKKIKTMTDAEFLTSLGKGEPVEVLKARHTKDAALAEAHKNEPLSAALRIRIVPGRPPKGEEAPAPTSKDSKGVIYISPNENS